MFIELTDHLRCPQPHDESYLVLLPLRLEGRNVLEGQLGCPVCGRTVAVRDGIVDFGGAPEPAPGTLTVEAVHALLGLSGPGGYLGLIGGAGSVASGLAALLPGIALVAVNPPEAASGASVIRAARLPLKQASMRGMVLGPGLPEAWIQDGVLAVLSGLRVVGEGPAPDLPTLEVLAEASGAWVGRRREQHPALLLPGRSG